MAGHKLLFDGRAQTTIMCSKMQCKELAKHGVGFVNTLVVNR